MLKQQRNPDRKKIMIMDYDNYICKRVAQALRNDHIYLDDPDIIIGVTGKPSPDLATVNYLGNQLYVLKLALDADIVVLNLEQGGFGTAQVISALRYGKGKKGCHVLAISSYKTWASTVITAVKKEARDNKTLENRTITSDITDTQFQITDINKKILGNRLPIFNINYRVRSPAACTQNIFQMQRLLIDLHTHNKDIQVNIITPGVIYGEGQYQLYFLFKDLFKNFQLKCWQHTRNFIVPMIHLTDLISYLILVLQTKPSTLFLLINQGYKHSTREEILRALVKKIQNKELIIQKINLLKDKITGSKFLQVDLPLIFTDLSEVNHMDQQNGGGMKWHCKGFVQNIDIVIDQFLKARPLNPRKIVIFGKQQQVKELLHKLPKLQMFDQQKMLSLKDNQLQDRLQKEKEQIQHDKILQEQNYKKKKKEVQVYKKEISVQLLAEFLLKSLNVLHIKNNGFILNSIKPEIVNRLKDLDPFFQPNQIYLIKEKAPSINTLSPQIHSLNAVSSNQPHDDILNFFEKVSSLFQKCKTGSLQQLISCLTGVQPKKQTSRASTFKLDSARQQGKKKIDRKSLNSQQYIVDNVLPSITECLITIATRNSQRPLEEFIKLLYKKSLLFKIQDPFKD